MLRTLVIIQKVYKKLSMMTIFPGENMSIGVGNIQKVRIIFAPAQEGMKDYMKEEALSSASALRDGSNPSKMRSDSNDWRKRFANIIRSFAFV